MNQQPPGGCRPIYCDPQVIVHDTFIPRFVPVIHPVIHVCRQNIVNVPQHIVQSSERSEVIDPGCPTTAPKWQQGQGPGPNFW